MKFVWRELFDAMQSIVSRCWLDSAGHGLPPPFTPVLAACRVGNHRTVYAAMVDEFGEWQYPEFQGDPRDVEVLLWMPRPEVSMRVDTAFALNADQLEAVTAPGINRMAELHAGMVAATQRAEAAEAKLAAAFAVGELWQCSDCHKICNQQEGADDEWPHLCDDCWVEATANQQSEVQP